MSTKTIAPAGIDTYEVVCFRCGRLCEPTTEREALDVRDVHSFETGHPTDLIVQFDGQMILKLVALVGDVIVDLELP